MSDEKDKKIISDKEENFKKLLGNDPLKIPQVGDIIKGLVISASKSEVKLDIDGVLIGIVRGPELYPEAEEYAELKPGDEVEATVVEEENENGELELSFRHAGQEKAWATLVEAFEKNIIIKVKIIDANKGGLIARYCQIQGFLPVSQLAPENYPRVSGGDKGKILEKLKSFMGREFEVKVVTLDEREDKIIFSQKDVWSEKQKDTIAKYKVGTVIEGEITAVTDFGVFVSFGSNMEGLIHISELAWQRIDNPAQLYKSGEKIKAEVISLEGAKIFLSAKKLLKDPWQEAEAKFKAGQVVKGTILKINPFGLFIKLDEHIHGLAHISQLGLEPGQKINDIYNINDKVDFEIMSIEPKEHRLGLKIAKTKKASKKEEKDVKVKKAEKAGEGEEGKKDEEDEKVGKDENKENEKKVNVKKKAGKKEESKAKKEKKKSSFASAKAEATADRKDK